VKEQQGPDATVDQSMRSALVAEAADAFFDLSVATRSKALLRTHHLERHGYSILNELDKAGPLRAADLAEMLGLDQSTMSRRITALRRQGLLMASPNTSDARSSYLSLSARGRSVLTRSRHIMMSNQMAMFDGWDDDQIREFTYLLRKYVESAAKYIISLDAEEFESPG
jgi:DNA-binding MarR family transcriptional regulator